MNILFVNYGDFTTNSLNHIAGFADRLSALGHACAVGVPNHPETIAVIPAPSFVAVTYDEVLAHPKFFPDGRAADIVHAWTPREGVRRFVLKYQRQAGARLVVHLEDNEEFLLAAWLKRPVETLLDLDEVQLAQEVASSLSHPRRYRHFLRAADGVTVIVNLLRARVPVGVPCLLLEPGVDFTQYRAQPADPVTRRELGLPTEGKLLVYTGSITFANEPEMRELYEAVTLLNDRGFPTHLVRTGPGSPQFQASLADRTKTFVVDLGFVAKARLPALLALADVLVQPGRAGPFNDLRLPSKLPEFLSAGRPVVLPAANLGLELRDGIDALVLQRGDAREIADACERIFGDPILAHTLGQNAVAFARLRFDLTRNTGLLDDFYHTLRDGPERFGSTARMSPGDTELSLALRGLAKRTSDPEAAEIAADLAPLVEALEGQDMVRAERARLERELGDAQRNCDVAEIRSRTFEQNLSLRQQHVDNLQRDLGLSEQHAINLNREITVLQSDLSLSQQHAINLDREITVLQSDLSLSQQHATNLASSLELANKRLQMAEESLRLTRLHADNLENLRLSLQRRIRELDAQCAHLDRAIALRDNVIGQRDGLLAQREAKIRSLQESFSWQLTSPLRFFRRKLIDPWRRAPVPAESGPIALVRPEPPPDLPLPSVESDDLEPVLSNSAPPPARVALRSNVDSPQEWNLPSGKNLLRGWCFSEEGGKLLAVRAVLADRVVLGTYGLRRPDVVAAVGGKTEVGTCGWQISVELTPADTRLALEVGDENGNWQEFVHTEIQVGGITAPAKIESYDQWMDAYDNYTVTDLQKQVEQADRLPYQPAFSVLMPVYNTPERWLRRSIDSVRAQTYPHWELCIADDASTDPHVRSILEQAAKDDQRIQVVYRERNGHIAAASNSALALASGAFIALLDHDDELSPNALFEVATALQSRRDADYLYSDEDKIDEVGTRHTPYFKPDWLPDLFHSQNYTSHLSIHRTELVRSVGGFRPGFEGSQDWDLTLRVIEKTTSDRICHIPKILYHWRAIPGSTALVLSEKDYPVEAARRALAEHFARLGQIVEILPVPGGHWQIRYPLPSPPPLVSLIIPTRNALPVLQRCIDSILEKTTYPRFEIVVVDNDSDESATLAYLATLADGSHSLLTQEHTARVMRYAGAFNYSAINNQAVRQAQGEIVGLLNNDLELITPSWLDEMVAQALRPQIGCVGAMLYYPNETIQHAGCVLGIGGVAGHAFKTFPRGAEGEFNRARLVQNYSAVTAACLVVRKAIYEQVGGFDEKDLVIAFNDIDFCLRVRAAGYRNLWTPFAEFYHHESASRGADDTPEKAGRFRSEVEKMLERWGPVLQHDPAYNPNLTLENENFSVASSPRLPRP